MKLVKIDGVWVNPKKVIMVQEAPVNLGKSNGETWIEITLEGSSPTPHSVTLEAIYEPNIIHTHLSLEEVVAIINGGLE